MVKEEFVKQYVKLANDYGIHAVLNNSHVKINGNRFLAINENTKEYQKFADSDLKLKFAVLTILLVDVITLIKQTDDNSLLDKAAKISQAMNITFKEFAGDRFDD